MDGKEMELSLLERVNPNFHTAQMNLYFLARSGDEDAILLYEKLGSSLGEGRGKGGETSDLQDLANAVLMETRFRTVEEMAVSSGCRTLVDLPCGYTPRALKTARRGVRYVGLDLPPVAREIQDAVLPMAGEKERPLIRFAGVDATNLSSLEEALEGEKGPICITTEGLLMYFHASEAAALCDGIHRLLVRFGGCWITSDPEMMLQNEQIMKAIAGERSKEVLDASMKSFEMKADVHVEAPVLMVLPWEDIPAGMKRALAFLEAHGLKAERVSLSPYMPRLKSLFVLSEEEGEAVKEGALRCAYWKITPVKNGKALGEEGETAVFDVKALLTGSRLDLSISGRMDTLTAPEVLALFEEKLKEATGENTPIDVVFVDCSRLRYISSAGLRVFLIMHKVCRDGIRLEGLLDLVAEILENTGFDQIFG